LQSLHLCHHARQICSRPEIKYKYKRGHTDRHETVKKEQHVTEKTTRPGTEEQERDTGDRQKKAQENKIQFHHLLSVRKIFLAEVMVLDHLYFPGSGKPQGLCNIWIRVRIQGFDDQKF
jgi:hypothetical protein